jgi:hypothetical protein
MQGFGNIATQIFVLLSEEARPRSPELVVRRNLQSVSVAAPAETLFYTWPFWEVP